MRVLAHLSKRSTAVVLIVTITFLMPSMAAGNDAIEFYVSTRGSDENPGTKEKPFATLLQARNAIRELRSQNAAESRSATVYLRGGTYHLQETLLFEPDDSGTKESPVVYRACQNEEVVISGGVRLKLRWTLRQGGIYTADVSGADGDFDQLFVDGRRMHMARYPNWHPQGYVFGGVDTETNLLKRAADWNNPQTGFLHAIHGNHWGSMHYQIKGVKQGAPSKSIFELEGGWQQNRAATYRKDELFVENILEEFDAPGEWFLDRENRLLYCYPPQGTDLNAAKVVAAGLTELFLFKGTPEKPVQHVILEGFTFRHTKRIFLDQYEGLLRGDWSITRSGAIRLKGSENCAIRDCFFDQCGGNGVFFDGYNRSSEVTGARFHKLGESGVCFVGSYGAVRSGAIGYGNNWPEDQIDLEPGPKTPDYSKDCRVHDCLIFNIGRVGKQTAGVFISMCESINVSHSTIYHVPRSGITINDGCWGGHTIEHNDVFDTVIETGDHGPFNSWGRDRYWTTAHHGRKPHRANPDPTDQAKAHKRAKLDNFKTTIIRHNRWWHGEGKSWGIDLDDGSSNYHLLENLTLGCAVKLREGFFRTVKNNIFIGHPIARHVCFDDSQDIIRHNIVVTEDGTVFAGIADKPSEVKQWDNNCYWSTGGKRVSFSSRSANGNLDLAGWRAKYGLDVHSIEADPQFVDPASLDFTVKQTSPAAKLGFRNFRMDDFGVLKPQFKRLAEEGHKNYNRYLHPDLPKRILYPHLSAKEASSVTRSVPRSSKVRELFGAKVKNMTTEAEKSAVGIGDITGVLLLSVPPESEAAKFGFRPGDCILKLNGRSLDTLEQLGKILAGSKGRQLSFYVDGNPPPREVILRLPDADELKM